MSDTPQTSTAGSESGGLDAVTTGGDALLGMAALGKTAAALALVVAIIFLCSYLIRRLGPGRGQPGRRLKVIGSTAVGNRERVVIVEVEDTWLVLGVGSGQVNKLHELPRPAPSETLDSNGSSAVEGGFASRFAQALKQNTGQALGKGRRGGQRD